ncbi:F0F1 ATP synthase subunit gamma [Aestuariimicrobium sp. p3-SID1156]|uniref:F0F1 ATP synthase subunit gamma n=1 Tax=Aestuariimicrobium sp. p3-SID1156 TaxID=2916038 RepID=UPI00223BE72C|nr:F0F1 ATP synthase subunit gamma [Aestuariimicrobium sp. p3-SID1156]MCT1459446.1 F0F1 ATP synthase subunit gamma [Aestuariimicrobium sp. p3-SID1156]
MASSLREIRERRRSVQATKKITRAMELIASSRIVKAQAAANAAVPYTRELTRALSAVATYSDAEHPLTTSVDNPTRAAVLVITSDRGLAGAYSASAIKTAEQLITRLRERGVEVELYLAGRKGIGYFTFRKRAIAQAWDGFSESPSYANAREIADALLAKFLQPTEEGGVDELHIVGTRFKSMLVQQPSVLRLLPIEIVQGVHALEPGEIVPHYTFEPDPQTVLDQLLPLYVANRVHFMLLQSAASEVASRQRAMKAATDNAQQLIEGLTRDENQARQAQITQEISEIVGGADALNQSA